MYYLRFARNGVLVFVTLTLTGCGPIAIGAAVGSGGGGTTTVSRPAVQVDIVDGLPEEGGFTNSATFTISYTSTTATRFQWRLRPQDPWNETTATSTTATVADGAIAFEVRGAADVGEFGPADRKNFVVDTVLPSMATMIQTARSGVGSVTLEWDAVADNNNGSGLKRYVVNYGSDANNLSESINVDASTPIGDIVTAILPNLELCKTRTARVDVVDNAENVAEGIPVTFRTNCGADGTFTELDPISFGTGETITSISQGDFDGDGLVDAFVGLETTTGAGRISVLRNLGANGFEVVSGGGQTTAAPV